MYVARLSSLPVSSKEQAFLQDQLGRIVEYVGKISEARGEAKKAEDRLTNVARKDEIEGTRVLSQEEAISGAEKTHNGFFVVPAIFEEV